MLSTIQAQPIFFENREYKISKLQKNMLEQIGVKNRLKTDLTYDNIFMLFFYHLALTPSKTFEKPLYRTT